MSKWWERFPTNDADRAEQYEEAKRARDRAWAEMSIVCRCSDPVPLRSYFKQKPCGRCGGLIG